MVKILFLVLCLLSTFAVAQVRVGDEELVASINAPDGTQIEIVSGIVSSVGGGSEQASPLHIFVRGAHLNSNNTVSAEWVTDPESRDRQVISGIEFTYDRAANAFISKPWKKDLPNSSSNFFLWVPLRASHKGSQSTHTYQISIQIMSWDGGEVKNTRWVKVDPNRGDEAENHNFAFKLNRQSKRR